MADNQEQPNIDFNQVLTLATFVKDVMPLNLSKALSVNLTKITRYEPVEKIDTRQEIKYLTAKTLPELWKKVNEFTAENPDCTFGSINYFENTGFVQLVFSTKENPTGEFVPAVFLDNGNYIELTPEQNAVFRPIWNIYADGASQVFALMASMFPQPEIYCAAQSQENINV